METPTNLTKLYYSMGEVAAMFGVNQSLLRYWDKEFPSLKPKKSRKGDRRFVKEDIVELTKIYNLVKDRGFTIEGARRELSKATSSTKIASEFSAIELQQLLASLHDVKSRLIAFKSNLSK